MEQQKEEMPLGVQALKTEGSTLAMYIYILDYDLYLIEK